MPPMTSRFVFATCQPGVERVLKAEVARRHPGLRSGYARPGLVTWKADAGVGADVELGALFARQWGASLGAIDPDAAAAAWGAARRHVWRRDTGEVVSGDEARPGEVVLDVITAPDEAAWVGVHVQGGAHPRWPGGVPAAVVPEEAPSRAFAKIEEAIAWSGAPVRAGERAVELGSAPGGASYALLRRGVAVVGVDPGAMDPRVLAYEGPKGARLTHLQTTLAAVRAEEFGAPVDWLLMDVHLAPQVALHQVRRLVSVLRPTLRGVFFTLKLNDWGMADELLDLLRRVEGMGLTDVRATQLPANRQELTVVAKVRR